MSSDNDNYPHFSNCIDYQQAIEKLKIKGFNPRGRRKVERTVDDLIYDGYKVIRIQCFDDRTLLPIEGMVDIFTRADER